MNNAYFVCVNPKSGAGKAGKDWKKIKEKLHKAGFKFEYALSNAHRETIIQTQHAIKSGYRKLIAVGGDGTLHHVVNGIFSQEEIDTKEFETSIISIGTGNDWIKYHDFPRKYDEAIALIKAGKTILQDVGKMSYENNKKQEFFMNFAGLGFDSYVVENTADLKKYGSGAYYFGLAKSLFSYKNIDINITIDDNQVIDGKIFLLIVGLGKYVGGGMKICKDALIDDGYFDITLGRDFSKSEVLPLLPKLFTGDFSSNPKVLTKKCKKITISVNNNPKYKAEADGELIGKGDFELTIIPKSLKTIAP